MTVLHINAVYGHGSTGVIVQDIHNMSLQNGIDSYVAYAYPNCKVNDKHAYIMGSKIDYKLHAVLSRINGKQAYFSKKSTEKLLGEIDKIKPSIVHLHNLHSNYIHLNMLLKHLADNSIPTIITLHDCWFYTGGCFHYTNAKCSRWLTDCGKCPKKKIDTPAYFFDKSQFILADRKKYLSKIENLTVVGVSEWITEEARKTFLKNAKTLTIYNGVDLEFYKPVESNFRKRHNLGNKFLILGMANKWLEPVNANLLSAFLQKIDESCVLVIVGCTREQRKRMSSEVIAIPYITDKEELREIYSSCDVFVNCTREESLSLVNIEAQACGTPVVTYSHTGVKETVDGVSGYCVPTGDTDGMFAMVTKIKKNGKKYYSNMCQEFVRQQFDKVMQCERYINLYNDISKKESKL